MDLALPEKTLHRPEAMYVWADSSAIPFRDASIDVVVSHHSLEHFPDYKTTLVEVRRVLNPQGWLWIAVPDGFGFDDALYRFIFEGGGHVNRFNHDQLVREIERTTETHLLRCCDLFSSFIYLRKPTADELQHYPARAHFLGEIPAGFLTFIVLMLNTVTRLLDKSFGTRYSQYGWAFVFARRPISISDMASHFNVCRKCGSGNSVESMSGSRRSFFGLRLYRCPHCDELNVLVSPPPNYQ